MIYIIVGIVIVALLLTAIVIMQPDEFRVTRTAMINAPVSEVFAQVNDFYKWQAWSPWAKLDPNAKVMFTGPNAGLGASYNWSGNSKIGEGSTKITESLPNERILIDLDFIKPFKVSNKTEFVFKAENENQTFVSWTMYGKANLMSKIIGVVMNCDKMVGGQFDEGFANIKAVVEKK